MKQAGTNLSTSFTYDSAGSGELQIDFKAAHRPRLSNELGGVDNSSVNAYACHWGGQMRKECSPSNTPDPERSEGVHKSRMPGGTLLAYSLICEASAYDGRRNWPVSQGRCSANARYGTSGAGQVYRREPGIWRFDSRDPRCQKVTLGAAGRRQTRGGARVIYYFHNESLPVFLLAAYGKSEKANLTKAERNAIAKLVPMLVVEYARGSRRKS